jgi:ssDNA-binding replication factor A large subunit
MSYRVLNVMILYARQMPPFVGLAVKEYRQVCDIALMTEERVSLSVDFKTMIESLQNQKPEISVDQLRVLIDEKKRKIGAGYLTDQGALFLVAADLGISLGSIKRRYGRIKDVFVGAKDVSIVGRIMNVYPTRKFFRKDTKQEIRNRTLTLYDQESVVRVKLWDDQTSLPDETGLRSGELVMISQGYVKSGLDGRPVINLSSGSKMEVLEEENTIPDIDSITIKVDDVHEPRENVVITGLVGSSPRISQFQNSRGEATSLLQLQLSNETKTQYLRTVIWNVDESKIPKIFDIEAKIRLIGVKIKQGNPQYGSGDYEIHGDEGTVFEFFGSKTDIEIKTLRVVSCVGEPNTGNVSSLVIDKSGKFLHLTIDTSLLSSPLDHDSMIECVPSRIFGNSMTLNKDDSYIRVIEDDESVPKMSVFESKIKDVEMSDSPYILEAIVLQSPNVTEVNTKNGELVPVSDTLIGDDTGEIRLVGWRGQSSSVTNLAVGDRIRVLGATGTKGIGGKTELTLKRDSSLIKIS